MRKQKFVSVFVAALAALTLFLLPPVAHATNPEPEPKEGHSVIESEETTLKGMVQAWIGRKNEFIIAADFVVEDGTEKATYEIILDEMGKKLAKNHDGKLVEVFGKVRFGVNKKELLVISFKETKEETAHLDVR